MTMDRFVKVTCRLAMPVAGLQAPYLDALCEAIMARKAKTIQESKNGHRHAYAIGGHGQSIATDAVGKLPIPIKRVWVDDLPIPCCSSPILGTVESDHAAHYTTAFPIDKAEHLHESERTKIMQTGGRFKSFMLPLRVRLVDQIVWYAVLRTAPTGLRQLLQKAISVGKKGSQGYGAVQGWSVETCKEDWSWYAESPDGPVLMRPLPAAMDHPQNLQGFRKSFGGCVGPYWQRDFWREIVEPC